MSDITAAATNTAQSGALGSTTVAFDDYYSVPSGGFLVVDAAHGLLSNDTNPDDLPVAGRFNSPVPVAPEHVSLNRDGSFSFQSTPNSGEFLRFRYELKRDPEHMVAYAYVTIKIVNTAPVPQADHFTVHAGQALTVGAQQGLLANDGDAEGNTLHVMMDLYTVGDSEAAQRSVNTPYGFHPATDGSFRYKPPAGFVGTFSSSYIVLDGYGGISHSQVTIDVQNAAPVALADSFWVHPGQTITIGLPALLANDSDADGDVLKLSSYALAGLSGKGDATALSDGGLRFAASAKFVGTAPFDYTISDGLGGSATAHVTVNVGNTAPTVVNDVFTVAFGTPLRLDGAGVLANDRDAEGDRLRATDLDATGLHGQLVLRDSGGLQFVPEPGFSGLTSAHFTVMDGYGGSTVETVSFQVLPPVAQPDAHTAGLVGAAALGLDGGLAY